MAKGGVISIEINAGTAQFLVDMDKTNAKLQDFGKSAQTAGGHTVSSMQSSSAAIRLLENPMGNNIRAVERLISLFPALSGAVQAAFPVVGAIAFGGLLARLGGEVVQFYQKIEQAPERIAGAFREINAPLKLTNDELKLANDRLANDIAKLEGKHENTVAVMLDEDRVAADRLADSLDRDLASLLKLMKQEGVGAFGGFASLFATGHAEVATTPFAKKIGGDTGTGGYVGEINQQLDTSRGWIDEAKTKEQADAIRKNAKDALDARLDQIIKEIGADLDITKLNQAASPGGANYGRLLEFQAEALRRFQAMKQFADLEFSNTALKGKKTGLEGDRDNAEGLKRADEAQKKFIEEGTQAIAQKWGERSQILEQWLKYYQSYLENFPETEQAINLRLGRLYEERNKQLAEIVKRGGELMHQAYTGLSDAELKADEKRKSQMVEFAAEAERIAQEAGAAIAETQAKLNEIAAKGQGGREKAGFEGQKLDAQRAYDSKLIHGPGDQIALMQQLAQIEDRERQSAEAKLRAEAAALDPVKDRVRIAELNEQADTLALENANKRKAAEDAITNAKKQQSLAGQIGGDLQQLPGQISSGLGGALASGIFGGGKKGEDIGQQVGKAMKEIGVHLLGDIFKQMIQKLIQTTIEQFGLDILNQWLIHYASNPLGLFAAGGNPDPSKPFIAGEKGPEIIHPRGAALTVIPNSQSSRLTRGLSIPASSFASGGLSAAFAAAGGNSSTNYDGSHTFNIYESSSARDTAREVALFLKSATRR